MGDQLLEAVVAEARRMIVGENARTNHLDVSLGEEVDQHAGFNSDDAIRLVPFLAYSVKLEQAIEFIGRGRIRENYTEIDPVAEENPEG